MVKYKFNCTYCGHNWIKSFFAIPLDDELKCPQCKDPNVRKLKVDSQDVFGYNIGRFFKKKEKKNGY